MAVFFAAVLIYSIGIDRIMSPVGNAVLERADATPVTLTGTVAGRGTRDVVADDRTLYHLKDPAGAAAFAGRRVRISGILHTSTGVLEVKAISVIDRYPRSRS